MFSTIHLNRGFGATFPTASSVICSNSARSNIMLSLPNPKVSIGISYLKNFCQNCTRISTNTAHGFLPKLHTDFCQNCTPISTKTVHRFLPKLYMDFYQNSKRISTKTAHGFLPKLHTDFCQNCTPISTKTVHGFLPKQ